MNRFNKLLKNNWFSIILLMILAYTFFYILDDQKAYFDYIFKWYENFSWQLTLIIIVFIYKREIASVIRNAKSIKSSYFEIVLKNNIENITHKLNAITNYQYGNIPLLIEHNEEIDKEMKHIEEDFNSFPTRSLKRMFRLLKQEYMRIGSEEFYLTNANKRVTFLLVVEFYYSISIIGKDLYEALKSYESVYNSVVSGEIDSDSLLNEDISALKKFTYYALNNLPKGPESYLTKNNMRVVKFDLSERDVERIKSDILQWYPEKFVDLEELIEDVRKGKVSINSFREKSLDIHADVGELLDILITKIILGEIRDDGDNVS